MGDIIKYDLKKEVEQSFLITLYQLLYRADSAVEE